MIDEWIKKMWYGNSLAVQWLGLLAFIARAQVRFLVRELRSHKPHRTAKKDGHTHTHTHTQWNTIQP